MNKETISDIRLGWLKRFCSLARHGSLVKAGRDCNADPTVVSDSIQRLEEALHRMLIMPGTARLVASGKGFVAPAQEVLKLADISSRCCNNVAVSWLQALIAVHEHGNYVKASSALGWKRHKVLRGVVNLQDWVGSPLVYAAGGKHCSPAKDQGYCR